MHELKLAPPVSPLQNLRFGSQARTQELPLTMADINTTKPPYAQEEEYPYAIQVDEPVTPPAQSAPTPEDQDKDVDGRQEIMVGRWEVGFCSCCTDCVPNCCMATFCPCVSLAQISDRLGIAPYECSLITLVLLMVVMVFTLGLAHLVSFVWIWQARAVTRKRFQLPGDCCGDCCAALCCPCCTTAQVATHIKSYKPGSCDFGPVDTLPAYVDH
ncbi:hypothetical protein BBJ28_00024522 [Nothophytophthora sp. Chile5]|nr:hypothetical protein BBJ28_00024522 [Nothophytophthora sp. Chile5]